MDLVVVGPPLIEGCGVFLVFWSLCIGFYSILCCSRRAYGPFFKLLFSYFLFFCSVFFLGGGSGGGNNVLSGDDDDDDADDDDGDDVDDDDEDGEDGDGGDGDDAQKMNGLLSCGQKNTIFCSQLHWFLYWQDFPQWNYA